LSRATDDFALSKPHLSTGKYVIVGTTEIGGARFAREFEMIIKTHIEVVILDPQTDIPKGSELIDNVAKSQVVCGGKGVAYLPTWVSGERREGAEMYLQFIESHCR
jgi:hypothetical protein